MRLSILAGLAIACSLAPSLAEAKNRAAVPIAPRYLSAGPAASPYEYRGVMPKADARFQPLTDTLGGRFEEWKQDPWLVPYQRSSLSMDFDGWAGGQRYRYRR